ncbi:MAG TPA: class I SAM-dependent methyltransferase [Chlamydiales bacterium]|nr:class I SAM-dependent methyltransferase [Chlamydiales bacterium]
MQSHHLKLAKKYWAEHLSPGDVVIDATCGNGHDTLFLCTLSCQVYSLDIQKQALEMAKLLGSSATFFHISHVLIHEIPVPNPPRLIVYNLGYLPGGDKSITTKSETTLQSIQESLKILAPRGALSITCYPGHEEGYREEQKVIEFLCSLSPRQWKICQHKYINKPKSPIFIWVENID